LVTNVSVVRVDVCCVFVATVFATVVKTKVVSELELMLVVYSTAATVLVVVASTKKLAVVTLLVVAGSVCVLAVELLSDEEKGSVISTVLPDATCVVVPQKSADLDADLELVDRTEAPPPGFHLFVR
jgi:hypothetical protein